MSETARLTDLSASRIGTTVKCGQAFKFQYVDKLPTNYDSAALLFGNAIHNGVEDWYGEGRTTPDNAFRHKEIDLVDLVRTQWSKLLPPKIWDLTLEVIGLSQECDAVASVIWMQRPHLKKPTGTKAFLESDASKQFITKQLELRELSEKSEVQFAKNDDAFKMYKASEQIAERIQKDWRKQPRPLTVEEPFIIDLDGYKIRGRIDQLRHDIDLMTGEVMPPVLLDIKSNKQPLTPMEAFIQSFLYNEAIYQTEDLPNTDLVRFFLVRHVDEQGHIEVQKGKIDRKKHRKLALRILSHVVGKIDREDFAPNYGHWCKMCNFNDICANELNLWEDGLDMNGIMEIV